MQCNRHGIYTFDKSYYGERIHIVRISGSWNVETAYDVIAEQKVLFRDNFGGNPFASIVDMRDWEVATPEVQAAFNSAVEFFFQQGMIYHGVLINDTLSRLQKNVAEKYTDRDNLGLLTRHFNEENEALDWCRNKLRAHSH